MLWGNATTSCWFCFQYSACKQESSWGGRLAVAGWFSIQSKVWLRQRSREGATTNRKAFSMWTSPSRKPPQSRDHCLNVKEFNDVKEKEKHSVGTGMQWLAALQASYLRLEFKVITPLPREVLNLEWRHQMWSPSLASLAARGKALDVTKPGGAVGH